MKFVYLDPGLISYAGHHASFGWHLTEALRHRGHRVKVYGHKSMAGPVRSDFNAIPLFRANPYIDYLPEHETVFDPICGWMKTFETIWQSTLEDLSFVEPPSQDDIVYVNSAFPAQLVAIIHWLKRMRQDAMPKVVMELNLDSGVVTSHDEAGEPRFEVPDPRISPKPMLWRYAGMLLTAPELQGRLKLVNFEASTIGGYEYLLRTRVEAWRAPFAAPRSASCRAGKRGFAIGILGYQREEKGFHLVPEISRQLLSARSDVAILVHNCDATYVKDVQDELRAMAATEKRVVLREGAVAPQRWADTLAVCDLILCPYDPVAFETRCSGMLNEALANAIPVVVPAKTSLATMFEEFGCPGATFETWDAGSVADAAQRVLNEYDTHAQKAFEASRRWRDEYSVADLVKNIENWAAESWCESLAAPA
jgi:glycosyltransferase involved in cell wall biosynthesis